MRHPSIIPQRPAGIALLLLVLFVLIAAVVNVPWALTRMRSRTTLSQVPTFRAGNFCPSKWPAATPHATAWPPPNQWQEGGLFGCRTFDVWGGHTTPDRNGFQMELQLLGWPCPVIELKQMWWDWNDPKLAGPESDPAPSLKLQGLLLNPLIVGGAVWIVLILPWIAAVIITRWSRSRRARCMTCGYPVGQSRVCTECGGSIATTGAHRPFIERRPESTLTQ